MKFAVSREVFEKLNNVCFGVVVARGIHNSGQHEKIARLLEQRVKAVAERFADTSVKEAEEFRPYREAFRKLGINPNKFKSSIEAMVARIVKKHDFPEINPVVDLGNAVSLKYLVPLGAHDLDSAAGAIQVRFSREGDRFLPFGQQDEEILAPGELIYAAGEVVKTRRWIWRQSERGKVTGQSRNIFFPIDGFTDQNYRRVMAARDELAALLQQLFGCAVSKGLVDINNREITL